MKYGGVSVYDGEVESVESFSGFHVGYGTEKRRKLIGVNWRM